MTSASLRWADWLAARCGWALRSEAILLLLTLAAAGLAVWQPLVAGLMALTVLILAIAWFRPDGILYAFVVLMGSVKINVYAGFFTFFPEYVFVVFGLLVWFARWAEAPRPLPEPKLLLRFAAWIVLGSLSFVFAWRISAVFARLVLMCVVVATTLLTTEAVTSRRVLRRALALFEVTAVLFAAYGIVQMVGLVAGFDPSPRFLEKYSNPDLFLGVGAPLRLRLETIFRANGFFNDPNIMGGYLAAAMCAMLALRNHHAAVGRTARAAMESLGFGIMGVCLLLTLSRSGIIAFIVGLVIVFVQWPGVLRQPRPWIALAAVIALACAVSYAVHIDPMLLVNRLVGSFDTNDLSNRTHSDVFWYGARLLARFPLTGAGLGNFGEFYSREIDPAYPNMMTHCAPMTYFAESGLPGGLAFLALIGWIAWQPWIVVRDRVLRARDPELHALATALFAIVVVLDVANLFYDYYLRTFIWVLSGLAVTVPRWRTPRTADEPA